jgi:BASS family bile acid:Na+ symporter
MQPEAGAYEGDGVGGVSATIRPSPYGPWLPPHLGPVDSPLSPEAPVEEMLGLVPLMFAGSLTGLLVAVGLDADLDDLFYFFRHPWWLAKAVVAVNLVAPLTAMAVVALVPVSPAVRAGILLMAVSPVPPFIPGRRAQGREHRAYAYGLYVALSLLSTVLVPLTVLALSAFYGRKLDFNPASVAGHVAMAVLPPLAIGLLVRRVAPVFAHHARGVISLISGLVLLASVAAVLARLWPDMIALFGNGAVAAMAVLAAVTLAAGHMLGGPDPRDRPALALTSASRHPDLALTIAATNTTDPRVTAAILLVMIVGLVLSIPYELWLRRRPARPALAASSGIDPIPPH